MPCQRMGNMIICTARQFSATDKNGKVWEWVTDYTGCPHLLRKDNEISGHQPHLNNKKHPFWKVFYAAKRRVR